MKQIVAAIILTLLAGGVMAADRLDAEKARLERNKQTVTAFYTTFMNPGASAFPVACFGVSERLE